MSNLKRGYVLVSTLLIAVACTGQSAPREASPEDVESHRIGDLPLIRSEMPVPEQARLGHCLGVHVLVNSEGTVVSVTANSDVPSDMRSQAEAAARATKYQPFETKGRAVSVEFGRCVMLLPQELRPSRHIRFPAVHDWNSVRVTLERTRCYGSCPDYSVEIRGDGTVLYAGGVFVAVQGKQQGSISRDSVKQLVEMFRDVDYYSLNDQYVEEGFDLPTVEISIEIDGHLKGVKDYVGLHVGMPMSVFKLENAIDRFAGTRKWVRSDAQLSHDKTDGEWVVLPLRDGYTTSATLSPTSRKSRDVGRPIKSSDSRRRRGPAANPPAKS